MMQAAFHSNPTFGKEFVEGVLMANIVTRGRSFLGFSCVIIGIDLRLLLCRRFAGRCRLAWCNFINRFGCSYIGDVIEWRRLCWSRLDVWIWDEYRLLWLELRKGDGMVAIRIVRSTKNWTKWSVIGLLPCWRSSRDVWSTKYWRRKWLTYYLVLSSFDRICLHPVQLIWRHVHSWMPWPLFKLFAIVCL